MNSKLSKVLAASLLITGLITSVPAPARAIPLETILRMAAPDKAKILDRLQTSDKAALVNLLPAKEKAGSVETLPAPVKAKLVDKLSDSDKVAIINKLPASQKAALIDKVFSSGNNGPFGSIFNSLLAIAPVASLSLIHI